MLYMLVSYGTVNINIKKYKFSGDIKMSECLSFPLENY